MYSSSRELKLIAIVTVLFVTSCPALIYASEATTIRPEDSLVIVLSSTPMGLRAGNAFVIGDGTLVVTAHHLVFEESEQGEHQMPGLVRIFSPYLGDSCDGKIIAADKELDLAVLKASWPGHPALQLADEKGIFSAERIEIIGIPAIIHRIVSKTGETFPESLDFQREQLPVDFVAVRSQIPRFMLLSGVGQLGDGWSGSPMLLAGSSNAAGCFVRLQGKKGQSPTSAEGPAVTQVKYLVEKAGQTKSLLAAEVILSRPKDGTDVFLLTLEAYNDYLLHKYNLSFEKARRLIDMRPELGFAYTLAAVALDEQGNAEQAEQYFQKVLKLNPEAANLKINYAQFLSERQPDKALEVLHQMWQSDGLKSYVALLMFNILSERGEYQRCSELLKETLKANSDNAYLWLNLGGCQIHSGDTDNAIISMSSAVELLPERGPFRGQLAHLMEQCGQLDGAEKHFRKLLEIEPENPVVHFWLAQFLAKHRPEAKLEALKEAQTALELPLLQSLPRQAIEELISTLQSQTEKESPK